MLLKPLTALILFTVVVSFHHQTNLQTLIDATEPGGMLMLPEGTTYTCNCVITKPITIVGKAKIVSPNADPALFITPRTWDVVLIDLEVTGSAAKIFDIVRVGTWQTSVLVDVPHNVTFDNVWIHGFATQEVQRGIAANGANITIKNSRITEIHGTGYDTQAVAIWNGPGPLRILDSRLEAAGENFMAGGANASIPNLIPSDIEVRRSVFFKPLSWKVGDPSYAGIHWSVKNLFELKNARNVIIDSNTFENCWGDAQIGYAVLFTVRNQDGANPWAIVQNVTFTNNTIKNSEQGFQLLGKDNNAVSQQGTGLLIQNNLMTGIASRGITLQGFYNVTIQHNTTEQGGNILVLTAPQSTGFIYRNNVTVRNPAGYGVKGDGTEEGTPSLAAWTPGYTFAGNVVAAADARFYPTGNNYPPDLSNLSSYKGTDGLVPGYAGSPTPTPTPTPSPSPTPTPVPSPSPTPPTIPCTFTVPATVTVPQWGSTTVSLNLSGVTGTSTVKGTPSSGQVGVSPQSKSTTGTSTIFAFMVGRKKNAGSVTWSSPCGTKVTAVN